MKKGRHRRFEEARALKRSDNVDFDGLLDSLESDPASSGEKEWADIADDYSQWADVAAEYEAQKDPEAEVDDTPAADAAPDSGHDDIAEQESA
ncbi:MAG: hypothetical protein V3V01_05770 [Acidimicrobiales bacterium]